MNPGLDARKYMLCWSRETGKAWLTEWPDSHGKGGDYDGDCLASSSAFRQMTFDQRKLMVYIQAMHVIVGDGIDPMEVHNALLPLAEYQSGLAEDMPGYLKPE